VVDLNSDMGEAFGAYRMGDDEALLDIVTSASVACGFHAGDPVVMTRTVSAAADRGVTVGAHVSYPDLVGFGRRSLAVTPAELTADVLYQLGALDGIARACGTRVRYVKAHGALYNDIAGSEQLAAAVLAAISAYDGSLPLLTLPGSVAMRAAGRQGLRAVGECFADRAYTAEGGLVPRSGAGAVITDGAEVVGRAVRMATDGLVIAADGTELELDVASICVHGDTPGAVELAGRVRAGLAAAGVPVAAFGSG